MFLANKVTVMSAIDHICMCMSYAGCLCCIGIRRTTPAWEVVDVKDP